MPERVWIAVKKYEPLPDGRFHAEVSVAGWEPGTPLKLAITPMEDLSAGRMTVVVERLDALPSPEDEDQHGALAEYVLHQWVEEVGNG